MSRRDTIIIAVLVNACVLAVLFMLAVRQDDDEVMPVSQEMEKALSMESSKSSSPEELNSFLKEIVINEPPLPIFIEEDSIEVGKKEEPLAHKAPSPTQVEITVKRGDALEKIARANGTTVEAIKKTNQLTSEKLAIGQVLKIPLETSLKMTMSPSLTRAVSPSDEYYIVKNGDNPWKIAKAHQVKFEDLLKMNDLDEEKARKLKEGDKIRVK